MQRSKILNLEDCFQKMTGNVKSIFSFLHFISFLFFSFLFFSFLSSFFLLKLFCRCANVNWARRSTCNVCNAPKTTTAEVVREGRGGGFNEREEVEYRDRVESDDEFDDFGRKKKKKEEKEKRASRVIFNSFFFLWLKSIQIGIRR